MLFDYAVYHGQSESGSLADFFAGKKRIKNFIHCFWIHSGTWIFNGQTNEFSRQGVGYSIGIYAVNRGIGGFQVQAAPFEHGISGIDCQIHDNLLHLSEVGGDQF